jgi:hypothetical protein
MSAGPCWGFQFGGIPAPCPDDDVYLELDFEDRVHDFLHRHGDPAPALRRSESLDRGFRGWTEVTARDGCVLRIEWSRSALRFTLVATERQA